MKIFVTGVGGQLGHDVMNELARRGHEGVGSDIAPEYSGLQDGTAVCAMPYVQLDITDGAAVSRVLSEIRPDAVIHCAAWTAVDAAEDAGEPAQGARHQRGRHPAHRRVLPRDRLQNDVHLHRLCLRRQGRSPLAAGLQGLRAAERLRREQAGRRAGRGGHAGEVLHRAHRLGVRPERQELHQDHAEAGRRPTTPCGW